VTIGSVLKPFGGMQTRSRVTAEVLAELGATPDIVSTVEPDQSEPVQWGRTIRAPKRRPSRVLSAEIVRLLRLSASDATVVIASDPTLMPAILLAGIRAPIIWDTNECQSLHYRRLSPTLANRLKFLAWLAIERAASWCCWRAVAIGDTEAATWVDTHPGLRSKVAVVDHAALAVVRDQQESRLFLDSTAGIDSRSQVLLFLGTLKAKQNRAAADWIVEELAPQLPAETTILLCGPGSDALETEGRGGARVVGLGAVDDVDSVVAAADLCLAPLAAGAGVKTKVLHYLAHSKRVVGTPVAFEGIEGAPGLFPVDLADFRDEVMRLSKERETTEEAGLRAVAQRKWLEDHHGRNHLADQWRNVLACLPS
jgi:hypothetical protein